MKKRLEKKEWDAWVDSCPARTLGNISGTEWMVFNSDGSFVKWLKAIPLFETVQKNSDNKSLNLT